MNGDQILLYIGFALMACSAIGAVIAGIVLYTTGKRLKRKMEAEYGSKRC